MVLPSLAFESIFSRLFVFNLLYEDSEVDFRYLDLGDTDRVLSIAGAGCGVAGLTAFHPLSIDVVDRNRAHLSLSAIKMLAPRSIDYEDFYQLLGHGTHPRSRELLRTILDSAPVPDHIKSYWQRHRWIFARGLYGSGLTSVMTQGLSRMCRTRREWLEEVVELDTAERVARVRHDVCRKLAHPVVRAAFKSPLPMFGQGINGWQKTRIEEEMQISFHDHVLDVLEQIAATDLRRNWLAWVPLIGSFNHDDPLALPPYLRADYHQASAQSRTEIRWHHRDIFDTLEDQDDDHWTYVNCSDAIDWMDSQTQRRLFDLVHRKGTDGATLLLRSVEGADLIERHGLQDRFRLRREDSEHASAEERSCLYEQVAFYELQK